jgi:DNA-binding NarL/FixJ family response regulator
MNNPTAMEKTHAIRIIIADDHELMRSGIHNFCKTIPEFEVIAEATNGKELVEEVTKNQPDIIITDIKMPVMDGVAATAAIKAINPLIGIVAFSFFDSDFMIVKMLEAGALGYVVKNASKEELKEAIMNVYQGIPYYCDTTSSRLTTLIGASRFDPYKKTEKKSFDKKELEIIHCFCQEMTSNEVAMQLHNSVRTIEEYRGKIFAKMGVRNVAGMVIYAIKNGLFELV